MKVIVTAIQKGGTGKTTTAAALAQAGVFRDKKVLAIDLDPQCNLSYALDAQIGDDIGGSFDLLAGEDPAGLIQHTLQGVDIIPGAWELVAVKSETGSGKRLQKAIQPLKKLYDLIIIDTPPTAGELQFNALQAGTDLIIPLEADIYNLQSLYQMIDTVIEIQKTSEDLRVAGYVLTRYDGRSSLSKQIRESVEEQAGEMGIKCLGVIRNGIAVKEASVLRESLFKYAPKSKPAADYLELFDNIMK